MTESYTLPAGSMVLTTKPKSHGPNVVVRLWRKAKWYKNFECLLELSWALYCFRDKKECLDDLLEIRHDLLKLTTDFPTYPNDIERADALYKFGEILEWMAQHVPAERKVFAQNAVAACRWGLELLNKKNWRNTSWCLLHLTLARLDIAYKNPIAANGHLAHAQKYARTLPNPRDRIYVYNEICEVHGLNAQHFTGFIWSMRSFFARIKIKLKAADVMLFGR